MAPMIEINNLTRRYGSRIAVQQLNLSVSAGELFGFVGPNGAGKTSTIRMMATILRPDSGEIIIAGHSVRREPEQVRRLIGYMPDAFGSYDDLKVWEYLDFFAACHRLPPERRAALVTELLELVDLAHRRDDLVTDLSRGLQQRLSLARALINDPQVLILDEPASGLDPRARIEIRALLVELSRLGKTVFFSTHILADVAEICTQVGILEAGQLVASGSPESLQKMLLPHRLLQLTLLDRQADALAFLRVAPGVVEADILPGNADLPQLALKFNGSDSDLSALLASLVTNGFPVLHFGEDRRDLEIVFIQATKGIVS
jgi:ABC-2 type transport system ATP-binding protein